MTDAADLQLERIGKAFGAHPVLRDVSLHVPAGELIAILGASGSGKTTLLRLICGFEQADTGRIILAGQMASGPSVHVPPERRRLGYVAQEGALFPHLTVAENILFGLPRRERRDLQRAAALLERVGLPIAYAARAPHQLSGGEQQRVALARALAPSPRLVLLDEPFSALDAALRVETRLAIAASLANTGATALLVTHDQAEALSLGHRVGVLRRGELVQVDTPQNLYRRPVDLELARFVGEAVVLPAEARGAEAECCLGRLPLAEPMYGKVDLLIRPEQLKLGEQGVAAAIQGLRFHGPDATVDLRLADGTPLLVSVPGYAAPMLGEQVRVYLEGIVVGYNRADLPSAVIIRAGGPSTPSAGS